MYVYVIGQNLDYWAIRTAETQPNPKEILTVTCHWSMDRICRRVCEIAEDGISVLFLVAHGETHNTPSRIALGQGLTGGTASQFNLLRNYWIGEYPRIEVHACYTASETPPNCRELPNPGLMGILRRARDPRPAEYLIVEDKFPEDKLAHQEHLVQQRPDMPLCRHWQMRLVCSL